MESTKRIAILEPFYQGSHAQWIEGLVKHSCHDIQVFKLPGKHWKWRMQGGAIALANQFNQSEQEFDSILTTSMMDVALLKSLITRDIPILMYFHENQFAYPENPLDTDVKHKRDQHYAFKNYTSALVADRVYFNSQYNFDTFFIGCEEVLRSMPDHKSLETLKVIQEKSTVLPLGIDFEGNATEGRDAKLILWNHRWEYDKGIILFLDLLNELKKEGVDFKLAMLGQASRDKEISKRLDDLTDNIVVKGFLPREDYQAWIRKSSILPVCSSHDFFGVSVVEAMLWGCHPLLPKGLAYPEHISDEDQSVFYKDRNELKSKLIALLEKEEISGLKNKSKLNSYLWENLINRYDRELSRC